MPHPETLPHLLTTCIHSAFAEWTCFENFEDIYWELEFRWVRNVRIVWWWTPGFGCHFQWPPPSFRISSSVDAHDSVAADWVLFVFSHKAFFPIKKQVYSCHSTEDVMRFLRSHTSIYNVYFQMQTAYMTMIYIFLHTFSRYKMTEGCRHINCTDFESLHAVIIVK